MSKTPLRGPSPTGDGDGSNASAAMEKDFVALKQNVSDEFSKLLQEWKDNDAFPDPHDKAARPKFSNIYSQDKDKYMDWWDEHHYGSRNDLKVDDRMASATFRTPAKRRQGGKRDDMVTAYLVEGESLVEGERQQAKLDKLPPSNPVNVLDSQLTFIIESSKDTSGFHIAPFVCLVQSTGQGKTRTVVELGKKGPKKIVYLPCKDMEDNTWMVPDVLKSVIQGIEHEAAQNKYGICEKKWCKFLDAVTECVGRYEDHKALHDAQITQEGSLGSFYDRLKTIWDEKVTPKKNPLIVRSCLKPTSKGVSQKAKASETISFDDDDRGVLVYPTPEFSEDNIVICLDEVSALSEIAYKTYRRAAKFKQILSIFSDTAASVYKVNPPNDHSTSTGQGKLGIPLPPIFRFHTIDLYWEPVDSKEKPTSEEYLKLFCAGRPRWGSFVKSIKDVASDTELIAKLVELATQLLTKIPVLDDSENRLLSVLAPEHNQQENKASFSVKPNMVACFACRFAIEPRSKISSILAKHCLASITDISPNREYLETSYMSEPVLAEASATYTSNPDNMKEVLKHVQASFSPNTSLLEAPRGDTGEMCVAALLGFMMDSIRMDKKSKYMSVPVPLSSLLGKFKCWDEPAQKETQHLVDEWEVNFTHFYRPYWTPTKDDLHVLWCRRCAYYVPAGHKGLDLLMPIRNTKTAEYGTIRVQVKNYKNKITQSERKEILTKLWPQNCAPYRKDEPFTVGLLITTGEIEEGVALYNLSNRKLKFSRYGGTSVTPKKRPRRTVSSIIENDTDPMVLYLSSSMSSCDADLTFKGPLESICNSTSTSTLDDQDPFASRLYGHVRHVSQVQEQPHVIEDLDDDLEGDELSEENMQVDEPLHEDVATIESVIADS